MNGLENFCAVVKVVLSRHAVDQLQLLLREVFLLQLDIAELHFKEFVVEFFGGGPQLLVDQGSEIDKFAVVQIGRGGIRAIQALISFIEKPESGQVLPVVDEVRKGDEEGFLILS